MKMRNVLCVFKSIILLYFIWLFLFENWSMLDIDIFLLFRFFRDIKGKFFFDKKKSKLKL